MKKMHNRKDIHLALGNDVGYHRGHRHHSARHGADRPLVQPEHGGGAESDPQGADPDLLWAAGLSERAKGTGL